MPDSINYPTIKRMLSESRINTYHQFFSDHSDQEIYGIYLWNMSLCGAFYPLLQTAEIALRNTINNVALEHYGEDWHTKIVHSEYNGLSKNSPATKLKNAFKDAIRKVIKDENEVRAKNNLEPHPLGYKPNFNKIVSNTNFVTWEYVLHPLFFRVSNPNYLWPQKIKRAFKNRPYRSPKDTLTLLYNLVSEIRPFRNRLSHHEPLWKGVTTRTETDALQYLNKKIDVIEKLIHIISSEKNKYLEVHGLIRKTRLMASKETLDTYRYRTQSATLSLKHKNKVRRFLSYVHDNDKPVLFTHGGRAFQISPA